MNKYLYARTESGILRQGVAISPNKVVRELNALTSRVAELEHDLALTQGQRSGLRVLLSEAQVAANELQVKLEDAAPSVEAVPGGYVVQCRDGGFGRVHGTEQAARESIQRGGGSGNIRPVFVGSAPTPPASAECDHKFYPFGDQIKERRCVRCNKLDRSAPASAGGLDKEAVINWAEQKLDICDRADDQITYRSFIYRIKRGEFDLKQPCISKNPENEAQDNLSIKSDKQGGEA